MIKEVKKLVELYRDRVEGFEGDNESLIKDFDKGELYMCDYANHADDAFDMGRDFGEYEANHKIVNTLEELLNKLENEGK